MIARILGEGQFEIADEHAPELNLLDDRLEHAAEADDETGFAATLTLLHAVVHSLGTRLPADRIAPSQLVLPHADASLDEVRALLADEQPEAVRDRH